MLEDFVDDLRRALNQRLDNTREVLEGNGDPAHPRGKIQGLKEALDDIDDLINHYAKPESVPEQLRLPADAPPSNRRFYGRAA